MDPNTLSIVDTNSAHALKKALLDLNMKFQEQKRELLRLSISNSSLRTHATDIDEAVSTSVNSAVQGVTDQYEETVTKLVHQLNAYACHPEEVNALKLQNASLIRANEELEAKLERASHELNDLADEASLAMKDWEAEREQMRHHVYDAQQALKQQEEEFQALYTVKEVLRAELNIVKQQLAEASSESAAFKDLKQVLKQQLCESQETIRSMSERLDKAKTTADEYKNSNTHLKSLLAQQTTSSNESIEEITELFNQATEKLKQAEHDLEKTEKELGGYKMRAEEAEEELAAVKTQTKEASTATVRQAEKRAVKAEERAKAAVEQANAATLKLLKLQKQLERYKEAQVGAEKLKRELNHHIAESALLKDKLLDKTQQEAGSPISSKDMIAAVY